MGPRSPILHVNLALKARPGEQRRRRPHRAEGLQQVDGRAGPLGARRPMHRRRLLAHQRVPIHVVRVRIDNEISINLKK